MYSVMPPVFAQPQAAVSRDVAGALGVDGQRPQRPARAAETARALRPADQVNVAADMRLPTRRDKLVGPVPAFVRNILQFLREKTMEPPRALDPGLPEFDGAPPASFGDAASASASASAGAGAGDAVADQPEPVVARAVPDRATADIGTSNTGSYGDIVPQRPEPGRAFDLKY
ncbi:MAG: hypothetical protein ACK4LQ_09645 [Pararhodobacter sp.]